jgi:copper chaperone CopZ
MNRHRIRIAGMGCGHCVAALRKELERLEGVTLHAVEIGFADVGYDPSRTTPDAIDAAVRKAGYDVVTPAP